MLHQTTFLTIYILMITFILGCALGSFTDCLAGRMLNGTSVLKGRSHCDACGHVLGVLDLVPLFSRLCLRGRCRYCGAKIPAEAFWTELVSGIACCLIMYRYDVSVLALRGILLWMVLLCLTLTDLHAWIIPDRLQIAGILIFFGTALGLPEPGRQMLRGVLTGAGLAVSMLALSLLLRLWKKGWMKGQTALEVRFLAPLRPDEEVYLSDSGQEGRNAVYLRTKQEGKEILSITEK